jgi:diaminopimelate decarboxylase
MFEAVEKMIALVQRLRASGIPIRQLDLGGGLGVPYRPGEESPGIETVVCGIRKRVQGHNLRILVEPGRSIVAQAGALITLVLYRKQTPRKEFIITDAAMNDLIRPALYQSHHEILPLRKREDEGTMFADVVGPVCETGDFLARNRELPNILPGDLLAIMTAGAYGFVQSSNYNSRPRVAEVLVDGDAWKIIRSRETFEDLIRGE